MLYPREKERERRRRRLDLLASKNSKKDKIGTGQVSSSRRPIFLCKTSAYSLRLDLPKEGKNTESNSFSPSIFHATLPDYRKLETPDKRVPFLLV